MTETRSFTDIICIMERCLMSWSSITKKVSGKNTLPSIFIHLDGNVATYQIYSVGVVKDTSEGYTYQFADDAAFASFLEATKASSLYDTGVEVGNDSQIVTLSTCTREGNDDRTIVHGVRVNVQPAGE